MFKIKKQTFLVFFLVLAVATTGIVLGRLSVTAVSAEGEGYEELKTFTEVLSMVKKHYVEDVKSKDLVYGAIRGMLNSLDPHSSFMTAEGYKDMQVETKGEFGGIGIQIGMKESMLTVISPIEDTPAFRAGIKAGDKIVKINNVTTRDMTLQDAVSKMRGTPKTTVVISIMREGWKDLKDFTLTREIIKVKSVKSKVLEGGIGYIKINQFQEQTSNDLAAALKKLNEEKISSLVLDLRNDPGGLLNSSIDVASQFLEKGKLVVYTKTRSGEKSEFFTNNDGHFKLPMVVLINQGSASASEIVAGALKDWNRAVTIGTVTFGKGSVQTVIPLSDGSGLRLTTAKYYTPKGKSIQGTGITPDIIVKLEAKNGTKEHPVFREKDLERHLKNEQADPKGEEKETAPVEVDEKDDIQLQRAVDILKTWNVFRELPKAP
ncbi:MAG: S41 family peptidase [Nitrospirae bacterium]|nr:S41 family peptidase [Nitrospirota bacterium]